VCAMYNMCVWRNRICARIVGMNQSPAGGGAKADTAEANQDSLLLVVSLQFSF
jgi:hypothetical protein